MVQIYIKLDRPREVSAFVKFPTLSFRISHLVRFAAIGTTLVVRTKGFDSDTILDHPASQLLLPYGSERGWTGGMDVSLPLRSEKFTSAGLETDAGYDRSGQKIENNRYSACVISDGVGLKAFEHADNSVLESFAEQQSLQQRRAGSSW